MQTTTGQFAGPPAGYPANQPLQPGAFQQPGVVVGGGQQQRRDYSRPMIVLNSLQIVNTAVNVCCGIAEIFLGGVISAVGVPIWAPLCFYLPAGILGVLSGKNQSQQRCLAIACLVMSIFASIAAGNVLIVEAIQAALADDYCYSGYYYEWCTKGLVAARRAVSILSALVALFELVVSIVASAYCCMVISSTRTQAQPMTVVYATTTAMPMGAYNVSSPPQFTAPQSQYTPYPGVMPAAGGAAGDIAVQLPPPTYNQDPPQTKN